MTASPDIPHRFARLVRAVLLLVTLVLGAALHELHHLSDPACDRGERGNGHPCTACAGLHGSTLVVNETQAPAPRATAWRASAPRRHVAATAVPRGEATPRAPPAS